MISYQMFWFNVGRDEKVTTYDLIKKHGISSNTLNRMKHGKPITTDTINERSVKGARFFLVQQNEQRVVSFGRTGAGRNDCNSPRSRFEP